METLWKHPIEIHHISTHLYRGGPMFNYLLTMSVIYCFYCKIDYQWFVLCVLVLTLDFYHDLIVILSAALNPT